MKIYHMYELRIMRNAWVYFKYNDRSRLDWESTMVVGRFDLFIYSFLFYSFMNIITEIKERIVMVNDNSVSKEISPGIILNSDGFTAREIKLRKIRSDRCFERTTRSLMGFLNSSL